METRSRIVARFKPQSGRGETCEVSETRNRLRCECGKSPRCKHVRAVLADRSGRLRVGMIIVEARTRGSKPVEMEKVGRGRWLDLAE